MNVGKIPAAYNLGCVEYLVANILNALLLLENSNLELL